MRPTVLEFRLAGLGFRVVGGLGFKAVGVRRTFVRFTWSFQIPMIVAGNAKLMGICDVFCVSREFQIVFRVHGFRFRSLGFRV